LGTAAGVWPACAQSPAGSPGPSFVPVALRRLPPVDRALSPPEAPPPAANETPAGSEIPLPAPDDLPIEPEPALQHEVRLWEGSFELGLNGTTGNSEAMNFRFGLDAKRKTPRHELTFDLDYRKDTSGGRETANRALLDWRLERMFEKSPWTCFVHGTVDYDEFQPFDARVAVDMGLGYQFIKHEGTSLAARLGSGFSREIGGPDERYVPEAVFGLDFEHRLNGRQKLTASSEYTPDMTGWGDCRIRTRAGWEMLIDEQMNLSLKLSVIDRYDSTPNGVHPNDLDYSAVLLWKF
jgi:putative salt-induced outer membrane protein YdiY